MQMQTARESRAPFAEWLTQACANGNPSPERRRELFEWYLEGMAPQEAVDAIRVVRASID